MDCVVVCVGGAALCANDLDQLASVECADCQASHCRDCDAILHRNPQRRTHKRYAIKGTPPMNLACAAQ
jgi:hypothetical protein